MFFSLELTIIFLPLKFNGFLPLCCGNKCKIRLHSHRLCVCVWLKSMVFTHFWHKTMTHFSLTALWRLLLWKWEQSTRSKTNGQTSIYKRNNSWTTELFIRFRNGTVETITAVGLGADTFLVEMWENLPHLEAYWHRSKMHLHSESREEIQRLLTKRSHNIQILTWFTWHQMIS